MTVSDFPLWSFWIREYDDDHWVLFVVEGRTTSMGPLDCRIVVTAVPLPSSIQWAPSSQVHKVFTSRSRPPPGSRRSCAGSRSPLRSPRRHPPFFSLNYPALLPQRGCAEIAPPSPRATLSSMPNAEEEANRPNDEMRCLQFGCPSAMRRQRLTVGDPIDRQASSVVRALIRAMGPTGFEYDRCGHRENAYQAIGRRAFTVEPLE